MAKKLEIIINGKAVGVKKAFDILNKNLDNTKKKSIDFGNIMGKVGVAMGAAYSVKKIVDFGKKFVNLSNIQQYLYVFNIISK